MKKRFKSGLNSKVIKLRWNNLFLEQHYPLNKIMFDFSKRKHNFSLSKHNDMTNQTQKFPLVSSVDQLFENSVLTISDRVFDSL